MDGGSNPPEGSKQGLSPRRPRSRILKPSMARPPAETEGGHFALALEREAGKAKLAEEIERLASERERIVVLLAGGSCSGKTTAAEELVDRFGDDLLLVSTDSYYRGRSWMHEHLPKGHGDNFDHPGAVDLERLAADVVDLREGRAVEMPRYRFDTAERAEPTTAAPRRIIVVEGLHALSEPLRAIGPDYGAFFDASRHGKFIRRLRREIGGAQRDTGERVEEIIARIAHMVEPMYDRHVAPTRERADLVILNDYAPEESLGLSQRHQVKYRCPDGFELPPGCQDGPAVTQIDHYFFSPGTPGDGEVIRMREACSEHGRTTTLTYRTPAHARLGFQQHELSADVTEDVSGSLERLYGSRLLVIKRRAEFVMPLLGGRAVRIDTVDVGANGRRTGLGTFAEYSARQPITVTHHRRLEQVLGRDRGDAVGRSYFQLARERLGV